MKKILIAEDEETILEGLQWSLDEAEIPCEKLLAKSGEEALKLFESEEFDLILLDIKMPGMDGMEFLSEIRSRGDRTPVIIQTAYSTRENELKGLSFGVDAYLKKPYSFSELIFQVNRLLSRTSYPPQVQIDDLLINRDKRVALRNDHTLGLDIEEFRVLDYLAENRDRIVPDHEVSAALCLLPVSVFDRLKRKIDRGVGQELLHCFPGQGFLLSGIFGRLLTMQTLGTNVDFHRKGNGVVLAVMPEHFLVRIESGDSKPEREINLALDSLSSADREKLCEGAIISWGTGVRDLVEGGRERFSRIKIISHVLDLKDVLKANKESNEWREAMGLDDDK